MSKPGGFTYCLNTSTIHECGLDVLREIDVVTQAGYQGIELWVSEIEAYLEGGGTLAELRNSLEQNGLEVPNLIAFFSWAHPDDDAREEALEEARRVLRMARELACPCVAAPPMGITDREDISLNHIADCYGDLLQIAQQVGVKPLLEFWGHSKVLHSLDDAMEVLSLVDDPDTAILADVFHMAKGGSNFELLRKLDGAQLGLIHLNDYPESQDVTRLTDRERVYPGDGLAPYRMIMEALREIEYAGTLSLELFNEAYQRAGALEVAQTGLEKMKQVVEAGG
ncbi:MAG: sugar phosphate isomerase/epimerase family protein [Chloroflexota bacterium]|nr:sugar phosphate isomerase/epimerase family protein [Chloroflexota bacterium]